MAQSKQNNKINSKEPAFIVKPLVKGYGLDYLHFTLIVLVCILVAVSFAIAIMKPTTVTTISNPNSTATHNQSQVIAAAERAIVSYSNLNTSLSLLPYYSLANKTSAAYVPGGNYWVVVMPYQSPYNKSQIYNYSLLVYDSNLTVKNAFINSVLPSKGGAEQVVSRGVIGYIGNAACNTTTPIPIYLFTDPYAPGVLNAIKQAINASASYGNSINMKYYVVFSKPSISRYAGFGIGQTQALGNYMVCASKQKNFGAFISNLSIAYTGEPLNNLTLSNIAQGSSLNSSSLNACLANSSTAINFQADLASTYNITSTPEFVVNCKYLAIPQTLNLAINYSLGQKG